MSSTQFPPAATIYPLSFHKPAASCLSFSHSRPLFSITSSLFGQKRGVGVPFQKPPFGISSLPPLFSGPVYKQVTPSPDSLRPGLPRVTRQQSHRPPLFSYPYESLFPQLHCFHIHTKPRGMGVSSPGVNAYPSKSFTCYHIHSTPAVSCNYALFCATAPTYPSDFQSVPHSFYRNGGVPPRWRPLAAKVPVPVSERDVQPTDIQNSDSFPIRRR
jgi:hypothetical protein